MKPEQFIREIKWIDIKDRKPLLNQNVYIAQKVESTHITHIARRVLWGSLEVEMFLTGNDCDIAISEVTHWALIPKPIFVEGASHE